MKKFLLVSLITFTTLLLLANPSFINAACNLQLTGEVCDQPGNCVVLWGTVPCLGWGGTERDDLHKCEYLNPPLNTIIHKEFYKVTCSTNEELIAWCETWAKTTHKPPAYLGDFFTPCPLPTPTPATGNLMGRVFVDENGNLLRTNAEAANERILRYNDTPQVWVMYKPRGSSGFIHSDYFQSMCGQPDGPYKATNLSPGFYDIQAEINVGEGWAFSEPQPNQFAIIPWPTTGVCTFDDGLRISGDYCTSRVNGHCTKIEIYNNPNIQVTAGVTSYLWFGVRKFQRTISGYVFIDENGNMLKDGGEENYNIEGHTTAVNCIEPEFTIWLWSNRLE